MHTTPSIERADAALQQLVADLGRPGANLMTALSVFARFPRYSIANQLLILAQCPHATRVMGFRAWQRHGYQVRKGAKGIAIWAPMRARHNDSAPAEDDNASGDERSRLRFRIAYVFDISSCDAPAAGVPADLPPMTTFDVAAPDADAAYATLAAFAEGSLGLRVERRWLADNVDGQTDGRTLTVNSALGGGAAFAALAHEAAHALLHFDGTRPDLTTRETEAEGVAYVVASTLGLATTAASVDYIRLYRGTPDMVLSHLERIRATALRLLSAFALAPAVAVPASGCAELAM